jgi:hypothetical protein
MWPWNTFKDEIIKVLKLDYLMSVLAVFLCTLIFGLISSVVGGIISIPSVLLVVFGTMLMTTGKGAAVVGFLIIFVAYLLLFFVISIVSWLMQSLMFITYTRIFLTLKQTGKINLSDLGYVFNCGSTKNIIMVSLKKSFSIALWSLLFVVPGIIKAMEYYMVDYLLAVNPYIKYDRAIEISKTTTNGNKFNIFLTLFVLSVIGSLGSMVAGIGVYFTMPILYIGMCEIYHFLGTMALSRNIATNQEIPTV